MIRNKVSLFPASAGNFFTPKTKKIPFLSLTNTGICDNIINCTIIEKIWYNPPKSAFFIHNILYVF